MSKETPQAGYGSHGQQAAGTTLAPTVEGTVPATGRRFSLERISRELTPEELSNPSVQTIQKLLLHLLDRAELEISELRPVVQQAHAAETQCAVLHAQAVPRRALEIVCGAALALGGVLVGVGPSLTTDHVVAAWMIIVIGLLFMGMSTGAQMFAKKGS